MKENFRSYRDKMFEDCDIGNIRCPNCTDSVHKFRTKPEKLYRCKCGGVIHEQQEFDGHRYSYDIELCDKCCEVFPEPQSDQWVDYEK